FQPDRTSVRRDPAGVLVPVLPESDRLLPQQRRVQADRAPGGGSDRRRGGAGGGVVSSRTQILGKEQTPAVCARILARGIFGVRKGKSTSVEAMIDRPCVPEFTFDCGTLP